MMSWDWHAKRLARILRDDDLSLDPRREMIEAILHLGEELPKAEKPTRHFEKGARVRTLCQGAVGAPDVKKGAVGIVQDFSSRGRPAVVFDDGRCYFCDKDQLELVPETEKRPFYEGDCLRLYEDGGLELVMTPLTLSNNGRHWEFGTQMVHGSRAVFANVENETDWILVAPGPNHPKEE